MERAAVKLGVLATMKLTAPSTKAVCAALLVVLVVCAYSGITPNEFILLDDPEHVSENLMIAQGLTWEGVWWAFTEPNAGFWLPLTWLTHMVDWQLFGANPAGHHWMNVAWHAANSVLVFWLLLQLTGRTAASLLAAELFAVHPLQVESVAWACERKNLLCMFFWLLAVLAYVAYARRPAVWRYLLVAAAGAASLMAKPMSVTLPCVLLLLDYWPLGRWSAARSERWKTAGWLVAEKLPLFAVSGAVSAIAVYTQHTTGAMYNLDILPLSYRLGNALWAYASYLGMLLWPQDLTVLYKHPFDTLPWWKPALSAGLLLAITAAAYAARRRQPYLLVGWLYYLGTLVPMIGLVQVGNQAIADRFTYLPHLGTLMALACLLDDVARRWRPARLALEALAPAVVVALAVATWVQVGWWRTSRVLFERNVLLADHELIRNNLGVVAAAEGNLDEAIEQYRKATVIEPRFADAHYNLGRALHEKAKEMDTDGQRERKQTLLIEAVGELEKSLSLVPTQIGANVEMGNVLSRLGDPVQAITYYQRALELFPEHAEALNNMGNGLFVAGKVEEALAAFDAAIRADAGYAEAYNGKGLALNSLGRVDEALAVLRQVQEIKPDYAEAYNSMGMALARKGDVVGAVAAYRRALELNERYVEAHYNLGNVLLRAGRAGEAIGYYESALAIEPGYVDAHINLAAALGEAGRFDEAVARYRLALSARPDLEAVHFALGNLLAARDRLAEAEAEFRAVLRINADHAEARFNLGVMLGKQGRVELAVEELRQTLSRLPGDSPLADQIRGILQNVGP